jgi:hypothetical protein
VGSFRTRKWLWQAGRGNRQADKAVTAGEVLFADVLLLPNGMSKVGFYKQFWLASFWFPFLGSAHLMGSLD